MYKQFHKNEVIEEAIGSGIYDLS